MNDHGNDADLLKSLEGLMEDAQFPADVNNSQSLPNDTLINELLWLQAGGTSPDGSTRLFVTLVRILKVYVEPLIAAVGLAGNVLSFVVFMGTYMRRSSSSIYLAALSLADAAFLVCVLVSWVINVGVNVYAQQGWCQTFMYLTYISSFLSVWYVVAFTVERYISIHFPLRRQDFCTTRRAKIVVAGLAAISAILYNFGTWMHGVTLIGPMPICAPLPKYTHVVHIFNNIDTVITLLLPFLAIMFMNVRIAHKVVQFYKERKHLALGEQCGSQRGSNVCSGAGHYTVITASMHQLPLANKTKVNYTRTQVKVTKMLLTVSTIFLLLNLPRHSCRMYSFIMNLSNDNYHNSQTYLGWEEVFRVLYYLHFSVNLFLYSMLGKNFRRALCWLWRRLRHGVSEHKDQYKLMCCGSRVARVDNPTRGLPLVHKDHWRDQDCRYV